MAESLSDIKETRARELKGFYSNKTVQRVYNFFVTFDNNPTLDEKVINQDPMPKIEDWHIRNVTIPNYDFQKEVEKYGSIPRSFPKLSFDGFEVRIELEEDEKGTIAYFINWLQRRILNRNGIYNPPDSNRIDVITVQIKDNAGQKVVNYYFRDAYFLKADDVQYDYATNDALRYILTFGVDYYDMEFFKQIV